MSKDIKLKVFNSARKTGMAAYVGALPTLGDLMLVKPGTSSRTLI
jgi:hypothetical protein